MRLTAAAADISAGVDDYDDDDVVDDSDDES